jgi:hypothetical protein
MKLTNAQQCTIRTLKTTNEHIVGPIDLYPGSEHYEAVIMSLHKIGTRKREFLVAPGGCVSEIMRELHPRIPRLEADNTRLRKALKQARIVIINEFGERDPLKPWDFIDEALKEGHA